MEKVELEAKKRTETGKTSKALNAKGLVPAVVYGKKIENSSLEINEKEFIKAISGEAGRNVIITLKIDSGANQSIPVITYAIQRNALTDVIQHVDFKFVDMEEKIKTKVPVELTGEPPIGVKDDGGILVHALREIEIECLPGDIPDKIEINVAELKIGDSLHVRDLKVPANVTLLTLAEEPVAKVSAPTKEEEVAPAVTPLAEGEVPVEGAVAPAADGAAAVPAASAKGEKAPASDKKTAAPAEKTPAVKAAKKEEKKK